MLAAANGHADCVATLLAAGADLTYQDEVHCSVSEVGKDRDIERMVAASCRLRQR